MDSALPIRGKICTVSHFIALDPHADPFFPSWFRLNQFAPWEALRSLYQLTMYIWRIIRNQSSWPSSPTARSRLSRVRMGSSSSRESLSDVMVSIRLSLITPIARYICSGSSLKFVLKVLSARRRSEFFSFFLLFFFFSFFHLSIRRKYWSASNCSGWPCSKLWSSRWNTRGSCSYRSMDSSCWIWNWYLYQFYPWTL